MRPISSAQMLGVGGDRRQRLGGGLEQEPVDLGLVLEGDGGDRGRQREHDMEVGNRQQFGLRARPATSLAADHWHFGQWRLRQRVVGDARMGAVVASLDMAAERCGAASFRSPT